VQVDPAMLDLCAELNLASVNRNPLAQGALTGKYKRDVTFAQNDFRNKAWTQEGLTTVLDRLDAVRDILTSGGRTLAQGALAWIWARSEQAIPIPGFKTLAQVEDNAGVLRLGPLTADQVREIDGLLDR
jgi:aryl-alcohol dehydrogenase-like predicted oxidoreductase